MPSLEETKKEVFGEWAVEVDGVRYPQAHRMSARKIVQECVRYDVPVKVYHNGRRVTVFSMEKGGVRYVALTGPNNRVHYFKEDDRKHG